MSDYFVIEDDILLECTMKNILIANIPNGIQEISENAFADCCSMTMVNFPESLKKIDDGAFKGCTSLLQVDLSDIKILGAYSFSDCTSLENVQFGKDISYLCNGAFKGCTSLKEIKLPENILYIGCECFKDCTALSSIEMESVMEIDTEAFEHCSTLCSLILPDTLMHIAPSAFSFCTDLQYVTVKNQFVYIDETAFENSINIIIRASQFSSAYRYAIDEKHKCMPVIINARLKEIDGIYVKTLKEEGLMFQMKPNPENPEKVIIRFDSSIENIIDNILGGK